MMGSTVISAGAQNSLKTALLEVVGWVLLVALFWSLGAYNLWIDYERSDIVVPALRVITNEASSGLSALILIIFIRAWLDRFPINQETLMRALPMHVLGALIFSLAHVGLMMLMRSLTYMTVGQVYIHTIPDHPFGVLEMLMYEFSKDIVVYTGFVAVLILYRRWLSAHNGATGYEQESASDASPQLQPQKLMVKVGKADKAIDFEAIDWLQASANYVRVFVGGQEYLVRATMAELEKIVSGMTFMRVHRSYIINLKKVSAVVPIDGGAHRIELDCGAHIPLGRGHKAELYERIKGV